jgi:periplasmic protein TonB
MTTTESRFSESGRNGTGLAITIGLHIGVAALALAGLGVIKAPRTAPPPIITKNIPDPATAPPATAEPRTIDLPVPVDVSPPIIDPTWYPNTTTEPPLVVGTPDPGLTGTPATIDPPPALGPTTGARFDKRYAGAAQPPYPPAARRMGEEGTVVVHVRIGRDGRVLASTLAQSSGSPRLDAAALAHALARWRFTPALRDGVAVEEERDISVRFELSLAG